MDNGPWVVDMGRGRYAGWGPAEFYGDRIGRWSRTPRRQPRGRVYHIDRNYGDIFLNNGWMRNVGFRGFNNGYEGYNDDWMNDLDDDIYDEEDDDDFFFGDFGRPRNRNRRMLDYGPRRNMGFNNNFRGPAMRMLPAPGGNFANFNNRARRLQNSW